MWRAGLLLALLSVCALSGTGRLAAHHGLDQYDTGTLIELRGRVVGFELLDPHSRLFVDVVNPDGSVTSWEVEGGAGHGILRSGVTQEMLAEGPEVEVHAYRSLDGRCAPRCRASGREFVFNPLSSAQLRE